MKYFIQKYSQSSPDQTNLHILSSWLTKKEMFNMYLNETTSPHVALSTFYQYFNLFFGPCKSYTPRTLEKAKKDARMMTLPTKIQGAIIYSGKFVKNRKCFFYLNQDHYEQSSNMIVTIILKLIETFIKDFTILPRKLHVFADNCWRENKVIIQNILLSLFLN